MWALLSILSAASFGAADFLGGLAARRSATVPAVLISQAAGLIVLPVAIAWLPDAHPARNDWLWGAVAGLCGGTGVALLYHALATGRMTIVAPVTAVCAVIVPVACGVAFGDRLSLVTSSGIALAAVAIVLVSQAPESSDAQLHAATHRTAVRFAIVAGIAIGFFLVALERAKAEAGLWPLVAARAVSITLFGIIALAGRQSLKVNRTASATAVAGGCLDMFANVLYVLAVRLGPLSLVATLASLYPASTVLLARATLGERLSRRQLAGVIAAIVATIVIVLGG